MGDSKVWRITLPSGEVWFEDWSETKEDAERSAQATFGDGCVVEEI